MLELVSSSLYLPPSPPLRDIRSLHVCLSIQTERSTKHGIVIFPRGSRKAHIDLQLSQFITVSTIFSFDYFSFYFSFSIFFPARSSFLHVQSAGWYLRYDLPAVGSATSCYCTCGRGAIAVCTRIRVSFSGHRLYALFEGLLEGYFCALLPYFKSRVI